MAMEWRMNPTGMSNRFDEDVVGGPLSFPHRIVGSYAGREGIKLLIYNNGGG